ncbi:MAG: MotA/TolQ/ExbB proton channel family protein [Opitutales bacterium]
MNAFSFLNSSAAGWAGHGLAQGGLLAQTDTPVGFNLIATFSHAEFFGKGIVILLLFASLLAWTVMIGKYLDLSRWRQMNLAFQAKLKQSATLLDSTISAATRQGGPYARLFYEAIQAARQHRADGNASVRMGLIENALQRRVAEECVSYETKMVVLGSLVSGAPFIGLLGTVWGVMVAFSGMGVSGNTTLQNLAPGVASALLATVSGLLVAIPSVFGYNFLLTHVKMMITEIENFASWLADRMELEIEASRKPPEDPEAGAAPVSPAPPPPAPAPVSPPGDPGVAAAERYLRLDVSEDEPR